MTLVLNRLSRFFALLRPPTSAELGRTLDFFKVPPREKGEVLAAFAAHKKEVTAGSLGK